MKTIFHLLTISLFLGINVQASNMESSTQFYSKDQISTSLNKNDIRILKHMREEEKLARDVYDYFYAKYELTIFDNISNAEQRHMDSVLSILTRNGIEDPASPEPGIFNSIELQQLYNDLIAQGEKSVEEALLVGASIEDVDIKDLMEFSKETDNQAILNVFERLTCGSRNHMRAFVRILDTYETTYTPKYISKKLFDNIINGNHEKCGQLNRKNKGSTNGKGFGSRSGNGMGNGKRNRGNRY